MSANTYLRQIAKTLPPMKYKSGVRREKITGFNLINKYIEAGKEVPSEIVSKDDYMIKVDNFIEVNHFKELKKSFKKGGLEAVELYCKLVFDKVNENKPIEKN